MWTWHQAPLSNARPCVPTCKCSKSIRLATDGGTLLSWYSTMRANRSRPIHQAQQRSVSRISVCLYPPNEGQGMSKPQQSIAQPDASRVSATPFNLQVWSTAKALRQLQDLRFLSVPDGWSLHKVLFCSLVQFYQIRWKLLPEQFGSISPRPFFLPLPSGVVPDPCSLVRFKPYALPLVSAGLGNDYHIVLSC